ncbi:hypothetical protein L1856_04090 [Streptomyces sp. Tue 6430]|nr:hypothetical protein [Streptomyces sp. Tue 6430]
MVFVHWLIGQSLYTLDKLCPYCAVVWVVTIALFWYAALHCLERGIVRVPPGHGRSCGTRTGCSWAPGTG